MSRGSRAALVILVVVLLLTPVATLHPVAGHLYDAGPAQLPVELLHPRVFGYLLLGLLAGLPALGFTVALIRAAHAVGNLRTLARNSWPSQLDALRYRAFDSHAVFVFSAGFFRPVTYASTGAESSLRGAQLHAALLHEEAHKHKKDIVWRLLLVSIGRAFAFLPWVGELVEAEILRTECKADAYAIAHGASRRGLFDAIVAASTASASSVTAGLTDGNTELRLMHLVQPETPLPNEHARNFVALAAAVAIPAVVAHGIALVAVVCSSTS